MNSVPNPILAVFACLVPLVAWRTIYPVTEAASVALLVLAVAIFVGVFVPARAAFRARRAIILRDGSRLARYLTGNLHAFLIASLATIVCIPTLTWLALTVDPKVAFCLVAVFVFSSILTENLQCRLRVHLKEPFHETVGVLAASAIATVIFLPILTWINFTSVHFAAELRQGSLDQSIAYSLSTMPRQQGVIADILSLFYAWDATKIWITAKLTDRVWPGVLLSVDSALVCYVVAQAGGILTNFVTRTPHREL